MMVWAFTLATAIKFIKMIDILFFIIHYYKG
jgi:hypothetical protein